MDQVPVLEVRRATTTYGSVAALTAVDLTIRAGEIVALVGDNGAGKSTLVKGIAGVRRFDSGEVLIRGKRVLLGTPADATRQGIETVYQDLALCDNLDVTANPYLGRERRRRRSPLLDEEAMESTATAVIADLSARLPNLDAPVSALSGGQRQAVAVSRAALWGTELVLLDEPTAALGVAQTAMVYDLIGRLRNRGLAVLVISHNMADVFAVADRIVVLRLGRNAGEFIPSETPPDRVVAAITGADTVAAGSR